MNQKSLDPYLDLHDKANKIVTPATFKRGIINAIHPVNGTVDVQLVGNQSTVLKNIYTSSAINLNTIRVGDKCRIDMFDETNPNDCVVAYVYGRQIVDYAWGIYTIAVNTGGGASNIKIPHTLGMIPTFATVSTDARIDMSAVGVQHAGVWVTNTGPNSVPFDNTYIYVTVSTSYVNPQTYNIFWFATAV